MPHSGVNYVYLEHPLRSHLSASPFIRVIFRVKTRGFSPGDNSPPLPLRGRDASSLNFAPLVSLSRNRKKISFAAPSHFLPRGKFVGLSRAPLNRNRRETTQEKMGHIEIIEDRIRRHCFSPVIFHRQYLPDNSIDRQ